MTSGTLSNLIPRVGPGAGVGFGAGDGDVGVSGVHPSSVSVTGTMSKNIKDSLNEQDFFTLSAAPFLR